MAKIMLDVASYQTDNPQWYKDAAAKGAKAVVVKLTEGLNYRNPKAAAQIKAAAGAGMLVHAYHYARYTTSQLATAEGKFFAAEAKRQGLNGTSVLVADVEDLTQPGQLTTATNAFTAATKAAGFPLSDVYSMRSWFQDGHLIPKQLTAKNLWIAEYGVAAPNFSGAGTWQFTNNWLGMGVDASYDYGGLYTGSGVSATTTWQLETGTFTLNRSIQLRMAPLIGTVIATLPAGAKVNYNAYAYVGGYVVIRQPRANGYGYLATGTASGTKRTSYWGSFS